MEYNVNDNELFAAFHKGDENAIRVVYSFHFKPLCFFALRLIGDHEDAQDLVANTFIKMLQRREKFQNLSNVKSFLYLGTKNACLNYLRANQRHRADHRQVIFLNSNGVEAENLVREELLRLEVLNAIYAEVEKLPAKCKEIFKLLFIEELSTEDIGERLGINPQTVRSQKARALDIIRSSLFKKKIVIAALLIAMILLQVN